MRRRKFQRTAARKKKEASESAAHALQKTRARFGIGAAGPLKGAMSSPWLPTHNAERRKPRRPRIAFRARHSPKISSTNANGRKVPKKLRLLSARCAAKPNELVRPTIREHFNTFQRGSTTTSGLQEKAHKSGTDHVSFTKTHCAQSASH